VSEKKKYLLASSTITSRQGGATCWQLTLVKNINSTHRVEGINSQYGLSGARQAAINTVGHGKLPSAHIPK
jgi:cyclopropane-fatty-acyl-phospholipid synthase